MKELINQFEDEGKMLSQLYKDLKLFKGKHVVVGSFQFYDRIAEKHTSVIYYYE